MTSRTKSIAALGLLAIVVALFFVFSGGPEPEVREAAKSVPSTKTAERAPSRSRKAGAEKDDAAKSGVPAPSDVTAEEQAKWPIRVTTNVPGATHRDPSTDADGMFEAFLEEAGPVRIRVSHPAFLFGDAAAVAPAADLVVVLHRGLDVLGRVEFPDHRPLFGANIRVGGSARSTTTDEDGRFVVSGLSRGPVGLVCDETHEIKTVDAGATGVTFVVRRSIARVRFLDAKGRPYRYAATSVRVTKDGVDLHTSAGSGANEVNDDLVSGDAGASVTVTASGSAGETGSGAVTFDETPRLVDLDVVIGAPRPTGTIRLLVRCDSAETPSRAYVSVSDAMGSVVAGGGEKDLDAAGAVELLNVPAGRVDVAVAAAPEWSTESLDSFLVTAHAGADVETGRTAEVQATFVTGGRVRVAVRDDDGTAIAPDDVRISTPDGGRVAMFVQRRKEGGWTTTLDTSPSILLHAVPPGRYVVQTTGPAGDDVTNEVDVVKGETADVVLTVKTKR